jgi:CheY-like chemotaxis protein
MNAEQWLKASQVIISFIQIVIWPGVLLFILLYFGSALRKFIGGVGEFSLKAGASGLEATAKRQIEAAALLGAASASRPREDTEEKQVPEEQAREIANFVSKAITPKASRRLDEANVLWVDDRPSNNLYERRAMEALGIRLTISTSTEDALERLRSGKFDVTISDMGRPPDPRAGYTLLDEIRRLGISTRYIIYAGSNAPKHKEEARKHGALGSTNNPRELLQLVTEAIQNG